MHLPMKQKKRLQVVFHLLRDGNLRSEEYYKGIECALLYSVHTISGKN